MFSSAAIIHLNVACMAFMTLTMVVLVAATRFKNGMGYMALASVATTLPVYLSNLLRAMDSEWFELSVYIALTVNLLCFPSIWCYIRSRLDSNFRLRWRHALHLLPALLSLLAALVWYGPMNEAQLVSERALLNEGHENLPALINDTLLFGQFFLYFAVMFRMLYRRRRFVLDHCADADEGLLVWLPRFLWLFFALFLMVLVVYVISPRTDVWLIPLLNTVGMVYLTYCAVRHAASPMPLFASVEEPECPVTLQPLAREEMAALCERARDYLLATGAHLSPELTLAALARAIATPQRTLSRAINGYRGCNFFEFVNGLRVEEAKRRLLSLETADYNIDSVYTACGFRSRSTFFLVFKKMVGTTPAAWLKEQRGAHASTERTRK